MKHLRRNNSSDKEEWLNELADVITNPMELLQQLKLDQDKKLREAIKARQLFPFRVPKTFVKRMKYEDPTDPLLRQVLTLPEEFKQHLDFSKDPINEQQYNVAPMLLHKYYNRAILLVKSGCAINCRYCFRRYFPYQDNQSNQANWKLAIEYIKQHSELNEIILSGGDPLMAKDHELDKLLNLLEDIPHLTKLRIHSRLLIVIPARITSFICQRLARSRLKVVLVTHINHAQEIDSSVQKSIAKLRNKQVTLLNQSVLLRGINDNAQILATLSETLFSIGILPYYLHTLDCVQGATHFIVDDQRARKIMHDLLSKVAGYLVPRLVRDISGMPSKTILSLG
ncbi:EF-P beta-lysylation protein EpmB [Candidatus Palibaumannia cicadellinicola]|uniref:L-lysine 2,3-aminomutase n=1 Tax=Baumannia cicadellinicola subsp. Homalodisca coagulata TaxID=374463 RepID=Q1LSP6_BAUCH|nr:EF-P beta-lysylation protein EpmB [Candidatus Baumannia cicadellinicola]ABF14052.1 YodO family protein [Baumannia cicadellinicola str. Hc (Homalodisca coagulata)]MCJ7461933.1 EF-P beta-lysylation protein EpmB [Candidatus Baumannia cicadellinicola]MCJ7463113.1 EF-P beta-lysylation protein EpmB [Candidatus Baumannia cicadellinicola]